MAEDNGSAKPRHRPRTAASTAVFFLVGSAASILISAIESRIDSRSKVAPLLSSSHLPGVESTWRPEIYRRPPPSPSRRLRPIESSEDAGFDATFLLGIFSTQDERDRRDLIRTTMLKDDVGGRVCALGAFLAERGTKTHGAQRCTVPYTFVVGGGDESSPTERLDDDGSPLTLEKPLSGEAEEDDVLYLNVRENMVEGKVPTWFRHASSLPGIDYIAKSDSDTLVSMPHLVEFVGQYLYPDDERAYGGFVVDRQMCGRQAPPCVDLRNGRVYMAGQFYFLSSDLGSYIVTIPSADRQRMGSSGMGGRGLEDFEMGTMIFSHPEPVDLVALSGHKFWTHGDQGAQHLKTAEGWNAEFARMERLREAERGGDAGARNGVVRRAPNWPG